MMKIPEKGKIVNCEDAMKCIFHLKELDLRIYKELKITGTIRADELAKKLGKERSTVYRSLQKLINCGICIKQTKTLEKGGYFHVYSLCEDMRIKKTAEQCIDEWYRIIKESIAEMEK